MSRSLKQNIMSKNLKKYASVDAMNADNGKVAPFACAIANDEGAIVGYKGDDGDVVMFQGGDKYVEPQHYYAVMKDGSKVLLDGMTSISLSYSEKSNVKSIDFPPSLTSLNFVFSGNNSVETATGKLDSVLDMQGCFVSCTSIKKASFENTQNVTNMQMCFQNCNNITSISLPELPNVTNMFNCFNSCYALTSISLPELTNVTDMGSCFQYCSSITSISLPSLPNISSFGGMFNGCTSLENLTIGSLNSSLTVIDNWAINSCTKLSVESLVNILNALPQHTSSGNRCTLGTTNLAKLSNEQKIIALSKNWTLE